MIMPISLQDILPSHALFLISVAICLEWTEYSCLPYHIIWSCKSGSYMLNDPHLIPFPWMEEQTPTYMLFENTKTNKIHSELLHHQMKNIELMFYTSFQYIDLEKPSHLLEPKTKQMAKSDGNDHTSSLNKLGEFEKLIQIQNMYASNKNKNKRGFAYLPKVSQVPSNTLSSLKSICNDPELIITFLSSYVHFKLTYIVFKLENSKCTKQQMSTSSSIDVVSDNQNPLIQCKSLRDMILNQMKRKVMRIRDDMNDMFIKFLCALISFI